MQKGATGRGRSWSCDLHKVRRLCYVWYLCRAFSGRILFIFE